MPPKVEKARGESRGRGEGDATWPVPQPGETVPAEMPSDRGPDGLDDGPGRSAASPGHLKKAAGAQRARDFAPGRQGKATGAGGGKRGRG